MVAATVLMAVPSLASADDAGLYVRGNVGYGVTTDILFSGDLLGGVEGDANVAGSLGFGYDVGNNWRVELDGVQLWNDLGAIGDTPNTGADIRITAGMMNVLYDFNDFNDFKPYIGAGVGIGIGDLSAQANTRNPVCANTDQCVFDSDASSLAWQLIAGVGYNITESLTWDTHYRYLNLGDLDLAGVGYNVSSAGLGPENMLSTTAEGVGAHMILTGLRYKWGNK